MTKHIQRANGYVQLGERKVAFVSVDEHLLLLEAQAISVDPAIANELTVGRLMLVEDASSALANRC